MNTLLHVLEAYTELFLADGHPVVGEALVKTLEIAYEKVFNKDFVRLETFFDSKMNSLADIHSYGHDIEATWLLDRAGKVLETVIDKNPKIYEYFECDAKSIVKKTYDYTILISKRILDVAFDGEALNNESRGEIKGNEHIDTDRIWWVQAEAVVGFVNAYQVTKDENFLDAAKKIFSYIENVLTDKREGSEWFWAVSKAGIPDTHGITEPWKCPYHNGRMCLELISRGFSI
jgi:mannobiose 2-epimerase